MKISFFKYHGTGNDFILIDDREEILALDALQVSELCDRHFGIGADGLILIRDIPGYDFQMKYYNADGSEGAMCGNGGRCSVAFYHELSGSKKEWYSFMAADGGHKGNIIHFLGNDSQVMIQMNDVEGFREDPEGIFINTGAPHLVIETNNIKSVDILAEGKRLRNSDHYAPEGTNVDFVENNENFLIIRTYERGVEAETLSCGTGATAAALASAVMVKDNLEKSQIIETRGGKLSISFSKIGNRFTNIQLEGPVKKVYSGSLEIK
jgi:diaminopimelate epimerase